MLNILNILKPKIDKDQIAELLGTNPEFLEKFENAYSKIAIDDHEHINAKQMAALKRNNTDTCPELTERIVSELIHGTKVYEYKKGKDSAYSIIETSSLPSEYVSKEEILSVPEEIRPELSGNLIKKDITGNSYETLLTTYMQMLNAKNESKKKNLYNTFRQGLDILDIDPVIYQMLSMNKNSMGYWLPKIAPMIEKEGFFKIPDTKIAKVPIPMLQLTRLDYMSHTRTTLDIVDKWAEKVFDLDTNKKYFIKTGTYSSKFDFRNAKITDPNEIKEIGEYLLFIHSQAISMAHYDLSGRNRRPIYGVSTTNEWVVREFIEDEDNEKFTIYHGLPLHTEYRVFVDFDKKSVLGIHSYWDPDVLKNHFGNSDTPDALHDYVTYTAQEPKLTERYNQNKNTVVSHIEKMLENNTELNGQWSIDIMQNNNTFWMIDMALAENSAFYDTTVPIELRNPSKENWIPKLKM